MKNQKKATILKDHFIITVQAILALQVW